MVWVYNSPFTPSEQKLYSRLRKKLQEKDVARIAVKMVGLYAFLRKSNFSSPKEIQESAFLDADKKVPIFTPEQAKTTFKALKKKVGGVDSKYPFTNHLANKGIDVATTLVPDSVKGIVQSVNDFITSPVRMLKENPYGDLLLGAVHGATETGVTVAGDVAEGVGGPIGAAVAAPLIAMAAGLGSLVALGEKDLGQSVAHIANAVPIIGSALGKGLTQMEHQVENFKKHPDIVAYVPVVGEYVTGQPTKSFSDLTSSLSLDNLKEQAKARGMAELEKRGIPTSVEQAQSRGLAELQKRAPIPIPTSVDELKSQGLSQLQKRGLPTSTADLQSKAISKLQERLPSVPTAGKRFSTQRRKYSKWPKTQRRKYVKT